jgi:type I restriction enzyme, S subunit
MSKIPQVLLDDVVEIIGGGTPSRDNPEYYNGPIPWFTVKDFGENLFLTRSQESITEKGLRKSASNLIPKGNVILVTRMAVGKVAINKINIAINQDLKALKCKSSLDPKYLLFFLLSQKETLESQADGATVKGITLDSVKELKIPLPPLEEQKRIAQIAGKCDRLRRTRRYTGQLSDTYLQSVFQEMFGDLLRNSKGWDILPIEDMSQVQGGLQVSQKRNQYSLKIPYLRVANIYRNYLNLSEIKEIGLTENELRRTALQENDILIVEGHGNSNEIGRASVWNAAIKECVHQNHLIRVRAQTKIINSTYLCFFINSVAGQKYFQDASNTTSGLNTISTGIVNDCPVLVPPLPLQEKFAKTVQCFERLRAQQRESDRQAEHFFQIILHRAFQGEL